MSNSPKPLPGNQSNGGQVRSLTQKRAEVNGDFQPSIYDVSYRKGECINCDDPDIAYTVRVGQVRVQKEMHTPSGRRPVTLDFLGRDEPLLTSRFFSSAKDDPELKYFAEKDTIIGEFPIASLARMFDSNEFLATYSRLAARHVHGLRTALFRQLERYQQKLEETADIKRQSTEVQRKVDELANQNIDLQLDLGEKQNQLEKAEAELKALIAENGELRRQLTASQSKQDKLRKSNEDLRQSQQALRLSQEEEIDRITRLSKERYRELRGRRDLDKKRQNRLWSTIESLLVRLGSPELLPSEIAEFLFFDDDGLEEQLPAAEPPEISEDEIEQALGFRLAEPRTDTAAVAEDSDDSEYEEITLADEIPDSSSRTPTLIPQWDDLANQPAAISEQRAPMETCPHSTPARGPMPTLDRELQEFVEAPTKRQAITQTTPLIPAFKARRPTPPPLPRPSDEHVGTTTAVMPSMAMPLQPPVPAKVEDRRGSWSWPDDGPIFSTEEPKSCPVFCPTGSPIEDADGDSLSTTSTWNLRDINNPKPVR